MRWLAQRRAMMSIALVLTFFMAKVPAPLRHERKGRNRSQRMMEKMMGGGNSPYQDTTSVKGKEHDCRGVSGWDIPQRKPKKSKPLPEPLNKGHKLTTRARVWYSNRLTPWRISDLRAQGYEAFAVRGTIKSPGIWDYPSTWLDGAVPGVNTKVYLGVYCVAPIGCTEDAAYTSTGSGDWDIAATWGGVGVPGAGDTFTVDDNHEVYKDTNLSIGVTGVAGQVNDGATLTFGPSHEGAMDANITVTANGYIRMERQATIYCQGATGFSLTLDQQEDDGFMFAWWASGTTTFEFKFGLFLNGTSSDNHTFTTGGGVNSAAFLYFLVDSAGRFKNANVSYLDFQPDSSDNFVYDRTSTNGHVLSVFSHITLTTTPNVYYNNSYNTTTYEYFVWSDFSCTAATQCIQNYGNGGKTYYGTIDNITFTGSMGAGQGIIELAYDNLYYVGDSNNVTGYGPYTGIDFTDCTFTNTSDGELIEFNSDETFTDDYTQIANGLGYNFIHCTYNLTGGGTYYWYATGPHFITRINDYGSDATAARFGDDGAVTGNHRLRIFKQWDPTIEDSGGAALQNVDTMVITGLTDTDGLPYDTCGGATDASGQMPTDVWLAYVENTRDDGTVYYSTVANPARIAFASSGYNQWSDDGGTTWYDMGTPLTDVMDDDYTGTINIRYSAGGGPLVNHIVGIPLMGGGGR